MMKRIVLIPMAIIVLLTGTSFAQITSEMDTIIVTASRLAQDQYKVAGNVTVITSEEIQKSTAQTIPDILRRALGVNIYDSSTYKSSTVDIRGFGDTAARNVLVMIDGRRINTIDVSAPDLVQIPIGAVERIEIIRGAGSVFYGDNAVGGVVNIITKEGEGDLHGRVGATYGSYDARSTDIEFHGKEKGLSYFLYAKKDDQRGFRQNSDLYAEDVNAKLQYSLTENVSARLQVGYHDDKQELPGGLSYSQIDSMGREIAGTPDDTSYTTDTYVKLGFDVTPWVRDAYLGNLIIDFTYRDRNVYDEFNQFSSFHTARRIDTKGVTAKYVFDRDILGQDVDFVTGIDFYDHENDIIGSGSNVDNIVISKREFGIYGFLEYELIDQLFVNLGTRYQEANYTFNQQQPGVSVFQEQDPDEWVSMGGLKYEYAQGSNIHANVQQTFRFLATDEWYTTANFPGFGITPGLNLNLQQQTGIQYELGIKHNFHDQYVLSITPYWIDLDNEIYFDPATFSNTNYDETRRIGVEIGNKFDLLNLFEIDQLDALDFVFNYTYQVPKFSAGSNEGQDIPFVPRQQLKVGLFVDFLKYFNYSLEGRYIGNRFAINDVTNNAPKVKAHTVLDTKLSFNHDNLEIFAAINNITDEKYFGFVSRSSDLLTISGAPAPERNYRFGVNMKF